MKLFFGTIIRNAPLREAGELVCLDWERKTVDARVPIFPKNPGFDRDPNPRGNTRGCKGILVNKDEIVAANYHTLEIYDQSLNFQRSVTHGLMVGLHEVFQARDGGVWVSSTVIDAALKYDLESGALVEQFWPREIAALQDALKLQPMQLDKAADNRTAFVDDAHLRSGSHLHLNSVCEWRGDLFALFHSLGVICNVSKGRVVIKDPALIKGHNLIIMEDGTVLTNDTYRHSVRIYNITCGELLNVIDVGKFGWVRRLWSRAIASNLPKKVLRNLVFRQLSISRPLFLRGLARLDDLIFVGISPASILCINWRSGELIGAYRYSSDVNACIHGLAVLA